MRLRMVRNRRDTFDSRARVLLERHIAKHWNGSQAAFAEEVGLSRHSLSFLLAGRTQPSLANAVAVQKLTKRTGRPWVTCEDWLEPTGA
jgi:DNA-binding XRE family transcriptional regulator